MRSHFCNLQFTICRLAQGQCNLRKGQRSSSGCLRIFAVSQILPRIFRVCLFQNLHKSTKTPKWFPQKIYAQQKLHNSNESAGKNKDVLFLLQTHRGEQRSRWKQNLFPERNQTNLASLVFVCDIFGSSFFQTMETWNIYSWETGTDFPHWYMMSLIKTQAGVNRNFIGSIPATLVLGSHSRDPRQIPATLFPKQYSSTKSMFHHYSPADIFRRFTRGPSSEWLLMKQHLQLPCNWKAYSYPYCPELCSVCIIREQSFCPGIGWSGMKGEMWPICRGIIHSGKAKQLRSRSESPDPEHVSRSDDSCDCHAGSYSWHFGIKRPVLQKQCLLDETTFNFLL